MTEFCGVAHDALVERHETFMQKIKEWFETRIDSRKLKMPKKSGDSSNARSASPLVDRSRYAGVCADVDAGSGCTRPVTADANARPRGPA